MSMFEPAHTRGTLPKVGLHSFKAGKLTRVEGTKKVKPDSRKGLIYLQEVDDLLHFYWKDRTTGAVEDDLIIFPEEAEFIKVKESPSGRVYALKFSSSAQILFYWMQEKDAKDDESDVKRVNDLIADPKAPAPGGVNGQRGMATQGLGGLAGLGGAQGGMDPFSSLDLSGAAQSMGLSQQQLMEMLGSENIGQFLASGGSNLLAGARPEAGGTGDVDMQGADVMDSNGSGAVSEQVPQQVDSQQPSGQAPASAGQQAAISHINDNQPTTSDGHALHDILAGIRVPQQSQGVQPEALDLGDVLTPELVLPLLADAGVRQQLFPHLPASLLSDPPTEAEVRGIMSSVQWRQALSGLSYALNNGGESVIRSLGIDAGQLQGTSGVEAFLRAVAKSLQDSNQPHNDDAMEE